ncbi:MAG: hypothetical protein KIT81_16275, partial [Alphaproteobacteria bacterium]|nr:hypothetical protein [Alphaproteobacteria bacterium]
MSGLLVQWKGDRSEGVRQAPDAARQAFQESGQLLARTIEKPDYRIDCFNRIDNATDSVVSFPDGGFAACAGTLFHQRATGQEALRRIYAEFDGNPGILVGTSGHFLLAIGKGGRLFLMRDRNGAFETYATKDRRILSTSFLALAAALPRHTLAFQEAYEYVFNGVTLGDGTVIEEIEKLGIDEWLTFGASVQRHRHDWPLLPEPSSRMRDQLLAALHEKLLRLVDQAAGAYNGKVRLALSGGYDSRLLVALLREAGCAPELYVYGDAASPDVRIAMHIAESEQVALAHLDKSDAPEPTTEQFP